MSKTTDRILAGANEATRRRNPHVFGKPTFIDAQTLNPVVVSSVEKRVRQETAPLMNKLESDWFANLRRQPEVNQATLRAQAKKFKLANGAFYKPDMTALVTTADEQDAHEAAVTKEVAWECKGPKQMKGMSKGMLTIKVAAAQWPEVEFRLVWRQAGRWHQQIILP